MKANLRQALRSLCLPISQADEAKAARALRIFFQKRRISYIECLEWVRINLVTWQDTGVAPKVLVETVTAVFVVSRENRFQLDGKIYFRLHRRLVEEFSLQHAEATAFISHLRLMEDLAKDHNLSAARISYVLTQLDARIHFSRQNIQVALGYVGGATKVTHEQLERLLERDKASELYIFADADLLTGAELVDLAVKQLGYVGSLFDDLRLLAPNPGTTTFVPNIQMLHFQCCLLEFYDHSALDLYEFNPRGTIANWLFEQYGDNLATAGNPYLNNAKSVGILDRGWVESKNGAARLGALALFKILSSLDSMSYAARREAAMHIRAFLFLFLRLSGNTPTRVATNLTSVEIASLMARISAKNSGSLGILEQRMLDAVGLQMHPLPKWRARGLGDSVNATNLSRKKIGDCEFHDASSRSIMAYESHGGTLTDMYVEEHIRTLEKIIPLRKEELETVDDIQAWQATIVFVAHELRCLYPAPMVVGGLQINFKFVTFSKLTAMADLNRLSSIFNLFFFEPIQQRRTPEAIRPTLNALMA